MTHFIFESLITVMDPHSPNKLIATEYCFLILGGDYQLLFLHFFIFRFFVINFYKNYFSIITLFYNYFVIKIIFIFSCSRMFRHVPECSVFPVLPTPISKSKMKVIQIITSFRLQNKCFKIANRSMAGHFEF